MKDRNVIRTKNFVGEIGEYLAIEFYNKNKGCPKLQATPPSTENIDAISRNGERYSIKCTSTKVTGVFYGVLPKGSTKAQKQLFEYVIVIKLNSNYKVEYIIELDWNSFLKYKSWHSRMNALNLTITNKMIKDSKILFAATEK